MLPYLLKGYCFINDLLDHPVQSAFAFPVLCKNMSEEVRRVRTRGEAESLSSSHRIPLSSSLYRILFFTVVEGLRRTLFDEMYAECLIYLRNIAKHGLVVLSQEFKYGEHVANKKQS